MGGRSKWKGLWCAAKILDPTVILTKIRSRASSIPAHYVGRTVEVHNGKKWFPVTINAEMVGQKFGDYVLTRERIVHNKNTPQTPPPRK